MSLLAAANAVLAGVKVANKGKECVQVVVRCRPFNKKEKSEGREGIIEMMAESGQVSITNIHAAAAQGAQAPAEPAAAKKFFTFDAVYDETSTQKGFYEESCYPLVESVMEGFNGTIFAYGQTGCALVPKSARACGQSARGARAAVERRLRCRAPITRPSCAA